MSKAQKQRDLHIANSVNCKIFDPLNYQNIFLIPMKKCHL